MDKTLYLQDRQYERRHKMPLIEYIDTSSTENKKEKTNHITKKNDDAVMIFSNSVSQSTSEVPQTQQN